MPLRKEQDILYIPPGSLLERACRARGQLNDQGIMSVKSGYPKMLLNITWSAILGGTLVLFLAAWSGLYGLQTGRGFLLLFDFVLLIEGLFLIRIGVRASKIRRRMLSLCPASELHLRLGVPESTARRFAEEHNIQPRCVVGGENLYDLADFGDPKMLRVPGETS